jgi:single-stranded-DNA-specific exonuclease
MSARLLCYTLIPRLNAPGRLDDATGAVCFLLAEDQEEALSAARELDRVNKERQRIEEALYVEAKKMLDEQGFDGGAIVLCGEGWHKGILGIVASRLCDEFYRPAVVLSVANGVAKGSARSVPEFDLYGGLSELKDMLAGFGGHRQAAGLRMKTEMIDAFRGALSDMVKDRAPELVPSLRIDADVSLREVNFNLVRELAAVEPFGYGNPEPVLGAKELEVIQPRVVGNGHLKMKLRQKRSNTAVEAIGFDMARMMGHIEESYAVDAAFTPQINEWENGRTLQLNLKGLRPSVS